MCEQLPAPIKEYYITYFDILGYQAFFKETPEKAPEFLAIIHSAVTNTVTYLKSLKESPLAYQFANLQIQFKIFSDNIILCIETGEETVMEKARIIAFMSLVSEIQRRFITEYGLFLRGGFTKGTMSVNDEYIFGEGLIEAVKMEETTIHPRIAVSNKIIVFLDDRQIFSREEMNKAGVIENSLKNGESISDNDKEFYQKMVQLWNQDCLVQKLCMDLLYKSHDGVWCLSYLYCLDIRKFIPEQTLSQVIKMMKQISPEDYEKLPKTFTNIESILSVHKNIIEQKLIKHSNYLAFKTEDIKSFDVQERILKKYVWSMVYHNYMCDRYNKPEYHINSQGNCENRHMKLIIHVFDKDGRQMTAT